jgi:hypothetical protein
MQTYVLMSVWGLYVGCFKESWHNFFEDEKCSYKELGVRESWVGFGFINRFSGGFFFLSFVGIYN